MVFTVSPASSAIGTRPGLEFHSPTLDACNVYDNETHMTSLSVIHPEFDVIKDTLMKPSSALYTFVHPQFHELQALAHHLLNGLCARNSGIDCCAISGSLSVVDLALLISDLVVDCPFELLKVLCHSLGFQSTFQTTRVELLRLLSM
jgi:hypothetical protein